MVEKRAKAKVSQEEIEEILAKSLKEPGVAMAVEAYDRAEEAYARVAIGAIASQIYVSSSTAPDQLLA